jgi:RNA polymerase sigma-70 factor (ECF subfamily)
MPVQTQPAISEISPDSDVAVARAIAAGDREAFRTLVQQHGRLLYRTARSIVKDDRDAEDAVQSAYLLAYGKISTFEGDSSLSTWLVRIVINEAFASGANGSTS